MREGQPHRGKLRARADSGAVESTSVRRKLSPFAGRRRKRASGRFVKEGGSLQPPRLRESVTRVLEGMPTRRGARHRRAPSLGCPRPAQHPAKAECQCGSSPPSASRWRNVGRDRGSFHGRGSAVRRVCSYVVARCRSRKAAPGSEKWISVTSNRTSISTDGA
jgi:hypothetical protein